MDWNRVYDKKERVKMKASISPSDSIRSVIHQKIRWKLFLSIRRHSHNHKWITPPAAAIMEGSKRGQRRPNLQGYVVAPNQIVDAPRELNLPEGWRYEEIPRTNPKYIGVVDKYYYEPGTGKKFRTYPMVLRHLETKKAELDAMKQAGRTLANGMKFKSVVAAKRAARALGSKFKSVIAAKRAARALGSIRIGN